MLPAYANINSLACPGNIAEAGNIRSSGCHSHPLPRNWDRQRQQTERKRRECPSPQVIAQSKYNSRSSKTIPCVSSCVPSLTAWSLLAQLWPGEGAPSLFPPSAGQGLPPPQLRKWLRPSASHSRRNTRNAVVALFSLLLNKLINRLKKWGNYWTDCGGKDCYEMRK